MDDQEPTEDESSTDENSAEEILPVTRVEELPTTASEQIVEPKAVSESNPPAKPTVLSLTLKELDLALKMKHASDPAEREELQRERDRVKQQLNALYIQEN